MNPPVFTKLDDFKKDVQYIGRTLMIYVLIEVLFNVLLIVLARYSSLPVNNPSYQGLWVCMGSIAGILPCILYSKKRLRIRWQKEEFEFNFSFIHIINVVCSIFSMVYFVNIILTIIKSILHIELVSSSLFQSTDPLDIFFSCFAAIIIAPVLEELLCRGIICRALARYSRFVSIIISGILFGMMHMNFQQGLVHMITGSILAYASLKYRSILLTIGCHMVFNTIATLLSYFAHVPFVLGALSIVMIVMSIYGLVVIFKEVKNFHSDTKYPYFSIAFKQISMILVTLVFILSSVMEVVISSILAS